MIEERPPEAFRQKREATIDQLREHYAQDHLGIDEFERRVDDSLRATSVADLEKLVSDLPALARWTGSFVTPREATWA